MAAYAIAVVVLGALIGLVVMLTSKKTATPAPKSDAPPTVVAKPTEKPKPVEAPYPPLPAGKLEEGKKLVTTFDKDAIEANRLYDESIKSKKAGDDKEWQAKLLESRNLLEAIKDQWNGFIGTLPSSKDYDIEQVARHYFPKEGGQVTQLIKKLAAMKSDQR